MIAYAFWNNKGGTGKTSLAFQTICSYACKHNNKRILVIDVCPQANLSELLLGGLENKGSAKLLERQGKTPRSSIGGYFQFRLPTPYSSPRFSGVEYITKPMTYNDSIPENIDLIAGDPLLELQANAINTLANNVVPGTNTWVAVIDWIRDLLEPLSTKYDTVFIDANPSFSIYTQIALSSADRLILPVMADDSSRRAIQSAVSLVYGLRLPSDIYSKHAFSSRLEEADRPLPKVHLIPENRITQYMGPASAYDALMKSIESDVDVLLESNPEIFSIKQSNEAFVTIRDFHTTGAVAFARGLPFFRVNPGRLDLGDRRIRVNRQQRDDCMKAIDAIVDRLD